MRLPGAPAVLVGIDRLEVQQLGDHEVGDLVVHRGAEEDDALVEQAREDVVLALAPGGALDDHGDEGHALNVAPRPGRSLSR
jgi:hypothetical protein